MPVDNTLYDRFHETWWQEDGFLHFLRAALNPARFGYMKRVLTEDANRDPNGLRVLDVGCGGGLLAEEFARLGCAVTGIDPSENSIEVAREHAALSELDIAYESGVAEDLPFSDASFGAVYCCDVLEHVSDVGATIAEIARVLEPGGVFMYDTVNRTVRSRLLLIKMAQDWSSTAWAEPDLHDAALFIRPRELDHHMARAGLAAKHRTGIAPANPLQALTAMRARARGDIGYGEMGRRFRIKETRDQSAMYAGYAIKCEG